MIICEKCHRQRRTTGWHICLEQALSRRLEAAPQTTLENRKCCPETPRHIGTFKLPGNGPAARIWNALVEGKP